MIGCNSNSLTVTMGNTLQYSAMLRSCAPHKSPGIKGNDAYVDGASWACLCLIDGSFEHRLPIGVREDQWAAAVARAAEAALQPVGLQQRRQMCGG